MMKALDMLGLSWEETTVVSACFGHAVVRPDWLAPILNNTTDVRSSVVLEALRKVGYVLHNNKVETFYSFEPENLGTPICGWFLNDENQRLALRNRHLIRCLIYLNNCDLHSVVNVHRALYQATLGEYVVVAEYPTISARIPIDMDFGNGEVIISLDVGKEKTTVVCSIIENRVEYQHSAQSTIMR